MQIGDVLEEYTVGATGENQNRPAISAPSCSIIEPDSSAIQGRPPYYTIKHERGEHRVICFLKAQGFSNKEIADQVGFTPVAVSNILRQPRAQQIVAEEIARAGRPEVETLLQGATADAVRTLIEINANDAAKSSDRIAAANSLIDRVLGKPKQSLDLTTTKRADQLSDDELAKLVTGRGVVQQQN
jgi:predicted transcriptional regulator